MNDNEKEIHDWIIRNAKNGDRILDANDEYDVAYLCATAPERFFLIKRINEAYTTDSTRVQWRCPTILRARRKLLSPDNPSSILNSLGYAEYWDVICSYHPRSSFTDQEEKIIQEAVRRAKNEAL